MAEWFVGLSFVGTTIGFGRLDKRCAWFAWALVLLCRKPGECMCFELEAIGWWTIGRPCLEVSSRV